MRPAIAACLLAANAFAQTRILSQYDKLTAQLSEPVETRGKHFGSPYFRTNERLLNRFYERFENAGGVTVGVSFQQNLSLLVHARPELCVIFDINPAVTEILTPFIGELMRQSPVRREFLMKLLAVDVTPIDVIRLLEGTADSGEVYAELLRKTPADARDLLRASWRATMEGILRRLPITAAQRAAVMEWQNILDREEYLTGDFFRDAKLAYTLPAASGWLSTEENYRLVRRYWMEGKIIGVTGDIGGSSIAKLAAWLRSSNRRVSVIYLSDVGTGMTGPGTPDHYLKLYETLGELPLRPDARVLLSHAGALTAYSRTYTDALWLYRYLSGVDYSTFFRLNQNVLQSVTTDGPDALFPALKRELQRLLADKQRRNEPLPAEVVNLYLRLMEQIETNKAKLKALDLSSFTQWAKSSFPSLDVTSPIFRTIAATAVEGEALRSRD